MQIAWMSWPLFAALFAISWLPMLIAGFVFKRLFRHECAEHATRLLAYREAEESLKAHADRHALLYVKNTLREIQTFRVGPEERREAFRVVGNGKREMEGRSDAGIS